MKRTVGACVLTAMVSVMACGLDLSGEWTVRGKDLNGRLRLPGTLADAKLGTATYERKITLSAADCAHPADPELARVKLAEGRTVVFTGQGRRGNRDTFRSVYWTGSKTWDWLPPLACTLGTHVFKDHPALAGFPTEDWADWQWYHLVQGARLYEIEGVPDDFRPITLSVNDFHFSYFSSSLFEYLESGRPAPMPTLDEAWFRKMFTPEDVIVEKAKMKLASAFRSARIHQ